MIDATLLASMRARFSRWLKLVPALFRRDPLFRYATIAAVLALIFLAVSIVQDVLGNRDGRMTGAGKNASTTSAPDNFQHRNASSSAGSLMSEPPAPGSTSDPAHEENPAVAPGRPLQGIKVAPAPRDSFGTVPEEGSPP
ncbi:hypothetical protein [Mesorhizobium sp.]|uniref:hypothetical protein n=1 Tax=Mesorhizobium sp. TaxID=1871066 RepID=UPI000FE58FD6|nr:hypothetical protein [Mesorhizobium sp.]RWK58568.1 MAG: hypothetical protein EOR49_30620 [Mesorhizobium sp.]RWM42898.1 MAG: hypothetical protein EOR76_32250 [Mesorhizobium sp.]